MPAIIRWFKVTHDINSDPELWELRELFGDRAGFVWLEILSIADRNNGFLGPGSPQLHAVLAGKCRVYSPKVRSILEWCLGKGWLIIDDGLRVAKWAKYNKRRETKEIPVGNLTTSLLDNPIHTKHIKKKSKIRYPLDFSVSETMTALARENRWPDPNGELEAFKDHHVAKDSRFLDWEAAFRTWLRNAKKWISKGPQDKTAQIRQRTADILTRGLK